VNLFDKTGTNIVFEMPPAGRIKINSVACATKETGTGTKSPSNPYTLTGTTKLTVSDGTTPHDYVLPKTGYSLPNGIADIFNAITGLFTQYVGKVVLDGSQLFQYYASTTSTVDFTFTISINGNPSNIGTGIISNRFSGNSSSQYGYIQGIIAGGNGIFFRSVPMTIFGITTSDTSTQAKAKITTWLAANPVTVLYQLAVPQIIQGSPIAPLAWPYNQATVSVDSGTVNLSVYNNWITPKTDWDANNDYFNLDPDYNRIKANILFLKEYSERMYSVFSLLDMSDFTIDDIPFDTFLNDIVNNVTLLEINLYKPPADQSMKTYTGGLLGWDASELNIIESNILRLFNAITGQWECSPKLSYLMGADEI